MYLQLDSDEAAMNVSFTAINESSVSLIRGRVIDAGDEELPFRFSYSAPAEGSLFDFYSADNIMSQKLVAALEGAGVNNLQKFETELVEERTGKTRGDYWTVNVVGLFVDLDKVNGALMFRLKGAMSDLVIHEKVAAAVRAGEFHGVVLTPVRVTR